MSRPAIPDLRHDHQEFTLEHCSVLLERAGKLFSKLYDEELAEICEKIDPEAMREGLLEMMPAQALSMLFDTEFGKGFIIGTFLIGIVKIQEKDDE